MLCQINGIESEFQMKSPAAFQCIKDERITSFSGNGNQSAESS